MDKNWLLGTLAIELVCPGCGALIGVWCGCSVRVKAASAVTRATNQALRLKFTGKKQGG